MALFNPTRDEVREFFFDTWQKFNQQAPLTDLEKIAVGVIHMHPEYHEILNAPERYKQQEYFPEQGQTNPFLHMSLHLSVQEQISINQPIGIADIYKQLISKYSDEHKAAHDVLECLGETVWHAQQNKTEINPDYYLQLLHKKVDAEHGND